MKSYRGSLALKLTNLLALVVISFGLLAQTPDFQINNNSQCFEGNRFVFTNHSSMGASAFLWNFGDGTTSTDSCPVKVFTYSGNYSVQLMVTYNNINYFINKTVEVNPEPICGFTYYAATNTGNSYTFQSTSYINSGNAIYSWNFGDSSYATGSNPSHIYTNNGLYKVTISGLSNKGCTCSSSKNVMVTVSAGGIVDTMNFNVNNNTQCLTGNNFTFNNTSGYINGASFSWNFGDGTTSASSNPTHNYTTSGSFIVSLIANIGGTDYVKTQIITVHPKTQITIGSSESVICRGTPVTFTAYPYYISGTASYTWLLNNKIVGNNSTTYTNPSVNGSDIVTCKMIADNTCQVIETDTSNPLSINILTPTLPAVTLSTNTTSICAASAISISANVTNTLTISGYNFKINGVSIQNSNSNTLTTKLLTDSSLITVDLTAGNNCAVSTTVTSIPLLIRFYNIAGNIWTGNIDSNYNVANNWCYGVVPPCAFIQSTSTNRYPVLTGNVQINNLTINPGTSLGLGSSTLTVNGTITGTGTITGSANASIIINSSVPNTLYFSSKSVTDSTLNSLNLNGSGKVTLGTGLNITNNLSLTNGAAVLDINNKQFTLKSTSITNSAQLNTVSQGAKIINGYTTVERFIPQGLRTYRDLCAGVGNAGSVFNNWQEKGATSNYGIYITGKAGVSGVDSVTGFDITQTGAASMTYYTNATWNTVTNTKLTNLDVYSSYRVLVRGARNFSMLVNYSNMYSATTIRTTGNLVTGDVTYTTTGTSNNGYPVISSGYSLTGGANVSSMVANPYVCPVDWESVYAHSANITSSYNYLDPTFLVSGYSTYVSYNAVSHVNSNPTVSAVNRYIQTNEAFFIQNNNTSSAPVLSIKETDKAAGSTHTKVFGLNVLNYLAVTLSKQQKDSMVNVDGAVAVFDNNFQKNIGTEDTRKFMNEGENLTITEGITDLSIDGLPVPVSNDILPLKITQINIDSTYQIKADASMFVVPGIKAYIRDNYLNQDVPASIGITFIPSANYNTYQDRFSIVFKADTILSEKFISINAEQKGMNINVSWTTTNEISTGYYIVEKSLNGKEYTEQFKLIAQNISPAVYSWDDAKSSDGNNFYRIKAVEQNGTINYSKTVEVSLLSSFCIYPNPAKGSITINSDKDNAQLNIENIEGKLLISKLLTNKTTRLDISQLKAGTYTVTIHSDNGNKTSKLVVE